MGQAQNDLISAFPHTRAPWAGGETVLVCASWPSLRGNVSRSSGRPTPARIDYDAAKKYGDEAAAVRRVKSIFDISPAPIDALVERLTPYIEAGRPIYYVVPYPDFDKSKGNGSLHSNRVKIKNQIPLAYAKALQETIGGHFAHEIIQKARVGRTDMSKFMRFLCQPSFVGLVDARGAYVIADDVFSIGGTLAALYSHIVASGGTVAAITTLAGGTSGGHYPLALTTETWNELVSLFGDDFNCFWERRVGHAGCCLTEAEGRYLCDWASEQRSEPGDALLQRLRDRLFQAAAKGK